MDKLVRIHLSYLRHLYKMFEYSEECQPGMEGFMRIRYQYYENEYRDIFSRDGCRDSEYYMFNGWKMYSEHNKDKDIIKGYFRLMELYYDKLDKTYEDSYIEYEKYEKECEHSDDNSTGNHITNWFDEFVVLYDYYVKVEHGMMLLDIIRKRPILEKEWNEVYDSIVRNFIRINPYAYLDNPEEGCRALSEKIVYILKEMEEILKHETNWDINRGVVPYYEYRYEDVIGYRRCYTDAKTYLTTIGLYKTSLRKHSKAFREYERGESEKSGGGCDCCNDGIDRKCQ